MDKAVTNTFNLNFARGEDHEAWAERFFRDARASGRLFRNEGAGFTYIDPVFGPSKIFTPDDFFGPAHSVVKVVRNVEGKDGAVDLTATFSIPQIKILFTSSGKKELQILRAVVREPVVLPFKNGEAVISGPGYNDTNQAGVYYYLGPNEEEIKPLASTHHLERCFSGVPFESSPGGGPFRNNLLAWLLGSVVFDPLMDPPLLVCSGNQQGIGKSFTVQSAGIILTGSVASPVSYDSAEFTKQLGARFREEERIIFLDNIVTPHGRSFDNPELSTLLTQGFSKKLRLLGKSRSVSASWLLFAMSVNDAKLTADLATRALPVKLYKEINGPMVPFCKEYAAEHRRELYGELLGLALRPAPKVKCKSYDNFRYRRWLDFVQARIEGTFGPLAIEEIQSLDALTQELGQFLLDLLAKDITEFSADQFVSTIKNGDFKDFEALRDFLSSSSSAHGKKIKAGRFLASKVGQVFVVDQEHIKMIRSPDSDRHEGARFKVIRVDSTTPKEFA